MARTKLRVLCALMTLGLTACGAAYDPGSLNTDRIFNRGTKSDAAMTAIGKGDFSSAETLGKAALRENPQDPYATLALAMAFQNTGRPEMARLYYQALVDMKSEAPAMMGMGGMAQKQTISEIAQANLAAMNGTAMAQRPRADMDGERQLMQRLNDDDALINRFQTLKRLLDEGLITREEYDSRRSANIGAILPYTTPRRPAAGLSRPAPSPDQVVQRLKALAAAYQERSISADEQSAERAIILDNLLPPLSARRADKPVPIGSQMEAASATGRLERLREAGVITQAEMTREKSAVMSAAAAAESRRDAVARMSSGMTPVTSLSGPGVQLATVGSESQAEGLWQALQAKYPDQLSSLQPSIKRVAQRHRPARYVLSAGSLADRKAAQALCRTLKAKGQSCIPVTLR